MIHIALNTIPNIVAASVHSATMKAQRQRTANTWQQRDAFEQFTDLFPGDLAKNVVDHYLTNTLGLQITNYDHIRTDNWANTDPYDLKIGNATIEVKSSIEKTLTRIEDVPQNRRIIIYANLQKLNDYIVQVYYIAESASQGFLKDWEHLRASQLQQKYGIHSFDDAANLFCSKFQHAHIMAFADRVLAEKYLRERRFFSFQGKTGRDVSRTYLNLFIRDAYPPEEFATHIP